MDWKINPTEINEQPPGTAMFVPLNKVDDDSIRKYCWVIRMDSSKIEELKRLPIGEVEFAPKLHYHGPQINGHEVGVLNIMVAISPKGKFNANSIYEAFCNEFDNTVSSLASALTTQMDMPFFLYGDSKEMEHSLNFELSADLRIFAQKVLAHISSLDYEWTPEEYEMSKQDLISNYPTRIDRWNK